MIVETLIGMGADRLLDGALNGLRKDEVVKGIELCTLNAVRASLPPGSYDRLLRPYENKLKKSLITTEQKRILLLLLTPSTLRDTAAHTELNRYLKKHIEQVTKRTLDVDEQIARPFADKFYETAMKTPPLDQYIADVRSKLIFEQIQTGLRRIEQKIDQIDTQESESFVDIPLNFPPAAEHFIGRTPYLTQLHDWLHPGRTITLHAPGGYGKTALSWKALQMLHDDGSLLTRFPDGVLFHTFYGQPSMENACVALAEQLRDPAAPPIDPRQAQAALHRALAGKRALIVLDGAEDAADLRTILDVRGACAVLISTRNQTDAPDLDTLLPVAQLSRADAITLLQTWMGEKKIEGGDRDRDVLDQICALVGDCLLYTSPSPRDLSTSRMPSSA